MDFERTRESDFRAGCPRCQCVTVTVMTTGGSIADRHRRLADKRPRDYTACGPRGVSEGEWPTTLKATASAIRLTATAPRRLVDRPEQNPPPSNEIDRAPLAKGLPVTKEQALHRRCPPLETLADHLQRRMHHSHPFYRRSFDKPRRQHQAASRRLTESTATSKVDRVHDDIDGDRYEEHCGCNCLRSMGSRRGGEGKNGEEKDGEASKAQCSSKASSSSELSSGNRPARKLRAQHCADCLHTRIS